MRIGSISVLALALCAAGCGTSDAPAPLPNESASSEATPTDAAGPSDPPAAAASLASPAPTAAAAPDVPAKFSALGTEPFWNARIDGTALVYTTPDDQSGQRASLTRTDKSGGAEFSGKLGRSAVHLEVTRQACSDGMSDRTYRFTAVLTIGSERREGCAA